jgi:hypothetical protein
MSPNVPKRGHFFLQIHLILINFPAFNQQLPKIVNVSDVVLGIVQEATASQAKEEERKEGGERRKKVRCFEFQ